MMKGGGGGGESRCLPNHEESCGFGTILSGYDLQFAMEELAHRN
jgi:hypothetical protein